MYDTVDYYNTQQPFYCTVTTLQLPHFMQNATRKDICPTNFD